MLVHLDGASPDLVQWASSRDLRVEMARFSASSEPWRRWLLVFLLLRRRGLLRLSMHNRSSTTPPKNSNQLESLILVASPPVSS